jgi:hypothetical protein
MQRSTQDFFSLATETVDRSTEKAVTCQQICRVLRMNERAEYADISLAGMHYMSLTLGQEFAQFSCDFDFDPIHRSFLLSVSAEILVTGYPTIWPAPRWKCALQTNRPHTVAHLNSDVQSPTSLIRNNSQPLVSRLAVRNPCTTKSFQAIGERSLAERRGCQLRKSLEVVTLEPRLLATFRQCAEIPAPKRS